MEFKTYTLADLEAALGSEDFWSDETLPITRQRAVSACHNPHAQRDDPVLLIARRDARTVGYLGILPDTLRSGSSAHRMGWLTGWWVDPGVAGSGIGAILLYKAMNLYPGRVGIAGGSGAARRTLAASQRFAALPALKGREVELRADATAALTRRLPALRRGWAGLKLLDLVLSEMAKRKRSAWERRNPAFRDLQYEYVASIDAPTERLIAAHPPGESNRKDKAELDWIMTCPWILSAPQKDSAARRYYFSSVAERFGCLGLKVTEPGGGLIGFLLVQLRNDRMTLLYSFFAPSKAVGMAAALVHHALAMDARTLRLYDERLIAGLPRVGCPDGRTRSKSRGFLLSKELAGTLPPGFRLHAGDGDFAFY